MKGCFRVADYSRVDAIFTNRSAFSGTDSRNPLDRLP